MFPTHRPSPATSNCARSFRTSSKQVHSGIRVYTQGITPPDDPVSKIGKKRRAPATDVLFMKGRKRAGLSTTRSVGRVDIRQHELDAHLSLVEKRRRGDNGNDTALSSLTAAIYST